MRADNMSSDKGVLNKILAAFPCLEHDERLDLVHQLEQNAQANIDFIMMMVLSTSLASLGLLADSTAVVIDAMLVAPLMGPLVAAGLLLVQANLSLFRSTFNRTADDSYDRSKTTHGPESANRIPGGSDSATGCE
jgi:hypothetical protein